MDSDSQPVQLRLGFAQPSAVVTLTLTLAGAHVLVTTDDAAESEARAYLTQAGANPGPADRHGLSFPAANLLALRELPEQVTVIPAPELATLFLLLTNPSEGGRPAELSLGAAGALWLSWHDGVVRHDEVLPKAAALALLTARLPFVATPEAFAAVRGSSMPLLVGQARANLDGFVEISTHLQQMVEAAPLPGLFRVDETHFGLALPHAPAIDAAPGFVWDGPRPTVERGPQIMPVMPMELSAHAAADLRTLVDALAAYRAQAVVWAPGLGRRVFALAAMEALDAWPLLIVCDPAAVWPWQRHLEMFGRSAALSGSDADARLVTYPEMVAGTELGSPQGVVFDDLATARSVSSDARTALRRLDGLVDAYRLALSSSWPTQERDVIDAMSVLRPGEFRPDIPVPQRYPVNASQRLLEHVDAYLSRRGEPTPGAVAEFRRSSVMSMDPSQAQLHALGAAAERHGRTSLPALLADSLEIISAGPSHSLSPKIAATIKVAQAALNAGRRVVVVTRHARTAVLVKNTLRNTDAVSIEASAAIAAGVPQARLVIVRFDRELPDLTWFDDVLMVDYPWSTGLIDQAVGPASASAGPMRVTLMHLRGTLDDRLAMLAARRRETAAVIDQSAQPSLSEMAYLLA